MASATSSPSAVGPDDGTVRGWRPRVATGVLVLANGDVIEGFGVGATGSAVGEVCFNTAMTGYQEILTDPSYAAQIITFTFPHIGIVGVNGDDIEVVNAAAATAAVGAIFRADLGAPSNFRAHGAARRLAEGARRRRPCRRRHPRADDADPQDRHAERRHRPCARRRLRPRRPARRSRGAGPASTAWTSFPQVGTTQRYDWDETSWTLESGLRPAAARRASMWSRSTTASSATSCASSTTAAAR